MVCPQKRCIVRVHIPGSEYARAIAESNHSWILLSEEREDRMGWSVTLSPWEYVDVSALDPEYTKEYPVTETLPESLSCSRENDRFLL